MCICVCVNVCVYVFVYKKSQLINSILTMGPKLWNDLNGDIQIIKNKNSYKKKLKINSLRYKKN